MAPTLTLHRSPPGTPAAPLFGPTRDLACGATVADCVLCGTPVRCGLARKLHAESHVQRGEARRMPEGWPARYEVTARARLTPITLTPIRAAEGRP